MSLLSLCALPRTLSRSARARLAPSARWAVRAAALLPTGSSSCIAARCAPQQMSWREYHVNGNEVKTGSTIKWEGKTWLVLGSAVNMRGRAHTTYNIDLKDVGSNSKISIKVRPADKIEVIELQTVRMNFLYRQGNTLYFMDPVSFEQVELDASLAPGKSAHYLIENSSTLLTRDGDTFVKIQVPEKVVCTVAETHASRGATKVNDHGGKEARLTNGLTVIVPNYIENGQHIVVNTANDTFTGKSEVPPEPEVEKVFQ